MTKGLLQYAPIASQRLGSLHGLVHWSVDCLGTMPRAVNRFRNIRYTQVVTLPRWRRGSEADFVEKHTERSQPALQLGIPASRMHLPSSKGMAEL